MTDEALLQLQKAVQNSKEQIETTGMVNIHRRLQITFGSIGGLRIERSQLGGLKVSLLLSRGGKQENVQNVNRGR